ncbi:hypothetical protein SLS56_004960 [Neofusicoccum ribis]|uniref:P-loop containing nucleoside triphosphate hydrolase protein n=1 Tax=Neofusicoccum ribis TaxID=45134 RepID=A0ABR3SV33_9PEZI
MDRHKPKMKRYFTNPAPESDNPPSPSPAGPAHRGASGWSAAPASPGGDWTTVQRPLHGSSSKNVDLLDLADNAQPGQDEEHNAWIHEKLDNMRIHEAPVQQPPSQRPLPDLPHAIREYVNQTRQPVNSSSWLSRQEIPTSCEILDTEDVPGIDGTISIPPNKVEGPWPSKETYLEAHYELLREDTILPLRQAVGRVKRKPWAREDEYGNTVGVYNNVHIVGLTFSTRGIAARVQFSLARPGKRVHWEQSKRLMTGSLVALTPEDDNFQTTCLMAVIAARPLAMLVQDPPEIDIFFARPQESEIDPGQSWVMVEERSSFFEGTRHTLLALQKLMREPFPLSEHIIDVQKPADAPKYVLSHAETDLSSIFPGMVNVNILKDWPENPNTELDKTQLRALQRMLTKRCAIIQGPPGTGKTHVSVDALKTLLGNMISGDAPIIVACQTNHALDQLLRHVAEFEPEFARLGGRSRDRDVIKRRTLYELKQTERVPPIPGGAMGPASHRLRRLEDEIRRLLSPLEFGSSFFTHGLLYKFGLLTEAQFESLEQGDTLWIRHGKQQEDSSIIEHGIEEWIGKNFENVDRGILPDDFAFEYEEVDLEFEQLKEVEAENMVKDDEDFETLRGKTINLSENIIGKESTNLTDDDVRHLLARTKDMYRIKDKQRGAVYNYLRNQAKRIILEAVRVKAKDYQDAVVLRTIGRWEQDYMILKKQKIIGMTTTGFSKYRALVSALNPKVVLIEEAAETLEAPVTAACVPSLEHLILVGDHQQLRPHCHVSEHENEPFNLNMSLFERLVKNDVEYDTLRRQRRMIPEIRRLVKPIYGDLIKDHPSVRDPQVRPTVPGMGEVSSFFFTHEWPESFDAQMSACNTMEADMVVNLYAYLFMNGVSFSEITVLTFYNGQRKLILGKLRSHPELQGTGRDFRVVTVDSYQGEENEVILLSLVRNNPEGRIGFLNNDNRVCVALSRAKRGFYMFGNGQLLASESKTWSEVITILAGKRSKEKMRIGYYLPLVCTLHGRKTFISGLDDWELVNGGCEMRCKGRLPCGHFCLLRCHPFSHENINCTQKCQKSDSTGSDPAAWRSYSQKIRQRDMEAVWEAHKSYQQQQDELEKCWITSLEDEMERSVFDDSYRATPSPANASATNTSSQTALGSFNIISSLEDPFIPAHLKIPDLLD